MRTQIALHGEKAQLFEEIHDELEEELGYRPSRPEVIGHLMSEWK